MEGLAINVAIIGSSYAGLTLANGLHLNSIKYTVFDRRSLPYNHAMGGSFNIPHFHMVQDRLQLKGETDGKEVRHKLTRKDVIDLLLERVKRNLISDSNAEEIIKECSSFYIITETNCSTIAKRTKHGPYDIIAGADGVLSTCRKSVHKGVFLLGDARWVNDRWFDLGLRRIERGADIATLDGLQFCEAICNATICSEDAQEVIYLINKETENVFCSREIYENKIIRQLAFSALLLAVVLNRCFQRSEQPNRIA